MNVVEITWGQCLLIYSRQVRAGWLMDEGKLHGALRAPFHSFAGYEAHPTLPGKAARLISAVATAHAYTDGNKRLAWHLGVAFLELNGLLVVAEQEDAANAVLRVVMHVWRDEELAEWLIEHTEMIRAE
ncbi:type II toxin-antitoxin system death-on-curing family toxin [Propionibacterium acidifaciens]|uniref:type II toxin-antitoxin system death-on-curing family toxin n=1 Tax=Propionibacterium acidifaciens TaxID=556499 RepID=UPI003617ED9C